MLLAVFKYYVSSSLQLLKYIGYNAAC